MVSERLAVDRRSRSRACRRARASLPARRKSVPDHRVGIRRPRRRTASGPERYYRPARHTVYAVERWSQANHGAGGAGRAGAGGGGAGGADGSRLRSAEDLVAPAFGDRETRGAIRMRQTVVVFVEPAREAPKRASRTKAPTNTPVRTRPPSAARRRVGIRIVEAEPRVVAAP